MPFLLTISERNNSWAGRSPVTTTHPTRQDAEAALTEYVRRNWEAELGTDEPDAPTDQIAEYFANVLEVYKITETA